jgi:two-component system phosphate regulon sensor histidine kinase PhoR
MFDKVMVEVADNGEGIETEDVPRVFERFFRTDASRSREKGGTGLGLAIVKHIIEAHDETVTVRSELGVGTTFSFTLSKV